jgi:hypothetical protein
MCSHCPCLMRYDRHVSVSGLDVTLQQCMSLRQLRPLTSDRGPRRREQPPAEEVSELFTSVEPATSPDRNHSDR